MTMFPCNECAKLLIQAGIGEVVFAEVCAASVCVRYAPKLALLLL